MFWPQVRTAAASATVRLYAQACDHHITAVTTIKHVVMGVLESVLETLTWLLPPGPRKNKSKKNSEGGPAAVGSTMPMAVRGSTNYHNRYLQDWKGRLLQNAQHRRRSVYRKDDLANPEKFPYTIALRRQHAQHGFEFEKPFIYLQYVLWGFYREGGG